MFLGENDIKRLIDEINQVKAELKSVIEASEVRIQLRIEESHERIRQLENENIALKQKVESLERRQNLNNIVIFGLNKKREEVTFDYIRKKLETLLEINLAVHEIKDIRSLGFEGNCPMKIEFASNATKRRIFTNCKKLAGTGISIANDLTHQQRQELAVLKRHLKTHRQNTGIKSFIKGSKLIVDGIGYSVKELIEIEQKPLEKSQRSSAPTTPSQPLLREVFEEETERIISKKTNPPSTPRSSSSRTSDTVKKQPQKATNSNNDKIRTRSTGDKKKNPLK